MFNYLKSKFPKVVKIARQIRANFKKPVSVRQGGQKRALICYIVFPFLTTNHRGHSNQKEVVVMANVLAELGYTVDVVDYNSEYDIDYSPYDLLIGFGQAYSRSFANSDFRGKRVLHFTGANPNFSNEAEARRARNLWERRGVLLAPRREAYWPWMFSAINSDAMFVLGNSWTVSTYEGLNKKIYQIPVPYVVPVDQYVIERDFYKVKHNFCWFSGGGAVHKGLDLLLEVFDEIDSDFHLDVCGPIGFEVDFLSTYKDSLFANPRVTFHGFVDVASREMRTIMENNSFVIFPSCSEGGGSSVITCMSTGMLPIVTKEASIDILDFGILIDYPTIASIRKAMRLAVSLSKDDFDTRSTKSSAYAKLSHSYDLYADALRESILKTLG
jgi:Glycosyl transferases group 1